MTATDTFIQTVERVGPDAVAGVLGYRHNGDPEDLAEDMLDAFEQLAAAEKEQAIRVLQMQGMTR